MLTYALKKAPGVPLYEALYRAIRADILSGALAPGEKLPSQRALATHLEVSRLTVMNAYGQLVAEGYLRTRGKVGYFVERVERLPAHAAAPLPMCAPEKAEAAVDLTRNASVRFPFSVWSRLQREVMLDYGEKLLLPMPNGGVYALRRAIAAQLAGFRGLYVRPENILVGAGTDFLYNLLVQLLGRARVYAVEEPGYGKIRQVYGAQGVRCVRAGMDGQGVCPDRLEDADVLHLSPSHHFPTGIITPLARRQALLQWAEERPGRYLIEDDYDSEFRFDAHPMPALAALDRSGRVIYLNTFTKTLAPSIRIGYLVLPDALMARFQQTLGFYGCTVPSFEQYTLARFLDRGYFEKHLNRMRRFYRQRRDQVVAALTGSPLAPRLTILEQDAGLHFLVHVSAELSDEELAARFAAAGIRVACLSGFYHGDVPEAERGYLVVNYSSLTDAQTALLPALLAAVSLD